MHSSGIAPPQDGTEGFVRSPASKRDRLIAVLLDVRAKDERHPFDPSPTVVAELHHFVARRVGNFADAADIAQQTLLVACAEIGTFHGGNLSRWLLTIARHLIVDHYRAENRFQFEEVAALQERESALRIPLDSVLAVAECRERLRLLLECITQRIYLEQQVALLLADVCGYCDKYSAAVLRMSLPCFKLLLHGARARLRQMADSDGQVERSSGWPHGARLTRALGVTCRLATSELLVLREKLLRDLKL